MIIQSLNDLKVEEAILKEEFKFFSIRQARDDFHLLVLTRMKKEAKLL